MSDFQRAFDFTVLRWEVGDHENGGLVDHPDDPGGLTKWGIAKRSHPNVDVLHLEESEARTIYGTEYWAKAGCERMPAPVALAVFDYAVHSSVERAVRALQRCVGTKRDGKIGRNTLGRTNELASTELSARWLGYEVTLVRVEFLVKLLKRRPKLRAFELGWFKRTHDLVRAIHSQ